MVDRICRRVFDVLNVFEAIEMISRDGKMIKWMENQEKQEETQLKVYTNNHYIENSCTVSNNACEASKNLNEKAFDKNL